MLMNFPDVARIIVPLVIGSLLPVIVGKIPAKTVRLRYSTRVERIALAAEDPIFGSVGVTWGANNVRNLYMGSVEVGNSSALTLIILTYRFIAQTRPFS